MASIPGMKILTTFPHHPLTINIMDPLSDKTLADTEVSKNE